MALGKFFVISGPSGVGKTTVLAGLLVAVPDSARLITNTTRRMRPGEINGREYHFLSREEFLACRDRGELLEWAEFCGQLHGSSKVELAKQLARHRVVFAILEVQGAAAAKAALSDCVTVFLLPGSVDELEQRLLARAKSIATDTTARLDRAIEEIDLAPAYHHVVVNREGHLDETVAEITGVIGSYLPLT